MTTYRVLAVAATEFRQARRLRRTWLLGLLVVVGGLFVYLLWSDAGSGAHASARFALPGFGALLLWVLLFGVVFLTFDIRARDERERIAEVLDTRPLPNIVLLGGRLVGIVLIAWIPLAVWALLLQVNGMIVDPMNVAAVITPEPVSLASFVFVDAPPAILLWGSLVMLLAIALRNRLVVCLVALALLAAAIWALFNTPLHLLPVVSGIANLGLPGSEILPRMPSFVDLAQRVSMLVLGAGLVTMAAAVFPRHDSRSRLPYVAWSAALLLASGAGFAGLVLHVHGERAVRVAWADAHRAIQQSSRLDLERVTGDVRIEPGRNLTIAVDLDFRVPEERAGTDLRFSLNPAMRVDSVRLDGSDTPFEHDLGILAIHPPRALSPGTEARLSVRAQGIPDPRFGYLDSSVWALDETLLGMPIVLQGEQASIFDARYVALMPAVRWLPMPGANFGTDNPAVHPPDFHHIDLAVELPDGWHAAGPGRTLDSPHLRFRPSVPLAEFPLIAAPFARRALTVDDGVQYELLIHPMHLASVEHFASEENLEGTLEHLRARLATIPGLAYPHSVFSLFEVPAQLRRYGGGRWLESVQSLPGIQMLPEHGLPTARFSARRGVGPAPGDMVLQWDLANVERFGPHRLPLTAGGARNLLTYLTSASGEGALAANYLVESLTAWLWRGSRNVAPGHWLQVGFQPGAPLPLLLTHRLMGTATFSFNWYQFSSMELEDRSAELSFTGFDPTASSEHADILIHKGNLIASAIQRLMGRERVTEFLALMRSRHGGGTFELDDLMAAMTETEPAMAPYIEHFMRESALPGFLASDLRVWRLADDNNGQPRYQLAVHVRNDEPVAGVAGISFRSPSERRGAAAAFERGDFSPIPGHTSLELGVVTRSPPREVRLETNLSRNRRIMRLALPEIDSESISPGKPFRGARPSDWLPPDLGIVVDDLDPGFSVVQPPRKSLRIDFGSDEKDRATVAEYDGDARERRWRRQEHADTVSWGKYRRTLTRIRAGSGEGSASFRAELPTSGTWRLHYHLPGPSASKRTRSLISRFWRVADSLGTLDLDIVLAERRVPVNFDASIAVPGWNDVGTFELPAGPVMVVVSDATTGDITVADAVRWEMVSPEVPAG